MAIIAENKGSNFKQAPAGNHVARCFSMVHIGTIEENILGTVKKLNKVRISFELPNELEDFGHGKQEPHIISKDFTLSMHEKASLRKFLESWRGKAFSEDEAKQFDIAKLLTKPCQIQIINKKAKNGNEYAEVSSVSTLLKGVTCPAQINETIEFSVLNNPFQQAIFDKLPEFLKDKIKRSEEYQKLSTPSVTEATSLDEDVTDMPF